MPSKNSGLKAPKSISDTAKETVVNHIDVPEILHRTAHADFLHLLSRAFTEDLGNDGDITSKAIFDRQRSKAYIIAKSDLRLAGLSYAIEVFKSRAQDVEAVPKASDGTDLLSGDRVLEIEGPTTALLEAERTALNFMAYLTGIATRTREMVVFANRHGGTVILDTRKTLPGYRHLAKEAVLYGGGSNHRMGLYDMVMIKDNHIDAAGGIRAAVERVRQTWGTRFAIEVECRNVSDVREALALDPEVIMLDNMDPSQCADALSLRKREFPGTKSKFEASGDMDMDKLALFAGLGLDYISVGKLTHSVTAGNFSMRIER